MLPELKRPREGQLDNPCGFGTDLVPGKAPAPLPVTKLPPKVT